MNPIRHQIIHVETTRMAIYKTHLLDSVLANRVLMSAFQMVFRVSRTAGFTKSRSHYGFHEFCLLSTVHFRRCLWQESALATLRQIRTAKKILPPNGKQFNE